jgi:SEC-C motif
MKNKRNAPCSCGSGKKYKKCCWLKGRDFVVTEDNKPPVKISSAIIEIARPWLEQYQQRNRVSVLIELSILAWNLSFSDQENQAEIESTIIKNTPEEIDAIGLVAIIDLIDKMKIRKTKLFSNINHIIVGHTLSFGDKGIVNLDIKSSPLGVN